MPSRLNNSDYRMKPPNSLQEFTAVLLGYHSRANDAHDVILSNPIAIRKGRTGLTGVG